MSVTAVPLRPLKKGSVAKLWVGIAALAIAAGGIAWAGTTGMQSETTESGLRIRVIEQGEGAPVGINDGVLIEYTGRLEDGTVFDSTEGRGPAPMLVQGVVAGFSEALQKMREGGEYRIWIPGELAYGASPPPGSPIPANATLEFDVKVLQVVPDAAIRIRNLPPGAM